MTEGESSGLRLRDAGSDKVSTLLVVVVEDATVSVLIAVTDESVFTMVTDDSVVTTVDVVATAAPVDDEDEDGDAAVVTDSDFATTDVGTAAMAAVDFQESSN